MTAEILHVEEKVLERIMVTPGSMEPIQDSPAGPIEIIGTQNGFAVRRSNTTLHDLRYEGGSPLVINFKDGKRLIISPKAPEDWKADPMLDPMV